MTKKIIFAITLVMLMTMSLTAFADERGNAIYKKLLSRKMKKGLAIATTQDKMDIGYGSQISRMKMTLINASGEKIIRIMDSKRLEMKTDGDRSIIKFVRPNDVKGTGLLTHEHKKRSDDQWLYLPARKRIKRISSDNKSGSFMGSEFSYEDMGSRELQKYKYRYIRDQKLNGIPCFVIERYPLERSSGYSKMVTWVNKNTFQPVRIKYYDRKREHLKTMLFKKYKKYKGKYYRTLYLEMENVQTGKKTTLVFLNLRLGIGLKKSHFTKRALEKR